MRHLTPIVCIFCGLTVLLFWSPPLGAQDLNEIILYQENFDGGQVPGWELEPGWNIVQDDNNWVLAGEGHQWASPDFSAKGDFRVQFRLKLLRGRIHLVYRMNSMGRYFIGFEEFRSDLNKQYWPDTFLHGLAGADVSHNLADWHQVEIVGQGATLRFLVDGQIEWEYIDADPLQGGSFAFETLDDAQAYVDDIIVYGPPPPPTPTPDSRFTWVRTGGPLGGLGYDVRMRPDNPDIMYVTDAWAGVFMTTDGGQTWFPSNEGITTRTGESGDAIPVFCLTIDPHNYDTIWIGTQNVRGIFKSTDGGRTWGKMDNGIVENEGITFRGITIDPNNPNIVYAAAEISSWAWAGTERQGREFDMVQGVVYQTTDGGQNWTPIWRGDNLARYVWVDPRDSNVVYISTGIFDREAANSEPDTRTSGGEGVLKSIDGGQTWTQINRGLLNLYVGSLFMHPLNPDILLAGTGNNQYYQQAGVYLSTDGGASWQQTLADDNINAVEFAESDPAIAYAGSSNAVYRSDDGGENWRRMSGGENGWGPPGIRAGFPIDFQVDPRDPDRIFANNYGGGNFLSADRGRTWTAASKGYTGAQVRDIAVGGTGQVFATARSGLFASHNGGEDWQGLNTPPTAVMEWYVVAVDPADSQHVLAANNWLGTLLQSHEAGQSWQPVGQHIGDRMMSWRAITFAPSTPQTVYAGTSAFYSAGTFDDRMPAAGVFVSHDGGDTWAPANDATSQQANVTDLAIDPQDAKIVYAATGNHGLLKSTDGGENWAKLNQGLPGTPAALAVAVHPTETEEVYLGLAFGGLYRSGDGGATWQMSANGMNPEAMLSDIVFDPTNPQVMYAADRFSGIYHSPDGGNTWLPINHNLRMRASNKLALSPDGQHLYAATEGEGVFRLDLNGEPPVAVSETMEEIEEDTGDVVKEIPTPVVPESTTDEGGGFCAMAAILPLGLVGLVWIQQRRK
ncbi:MAG: hypothetical protein JXM69_11865 [Anaerolineae bacterium]|nr:hypothetical protein [Anaerolineae bacterium]